MTRIKRPAAAAGAAVLLAFSLSACGGAPTDASKDDYCEAVNTDALSDVDFEDPDSYIDALKEQAEELEEVGTPDDISDDEREGFEIYVDAIKDVDADDLENPEEIEDEFSDDENEKVDKYFTYQAATCTPELPDLEDLPTDGLTDGLTE